MSFVDFVDWLRFKQGEEVCFLSSLSLVSFWHFLYTLCVLWCVCSSTLLIYFLTIYKKKSSL